MKIQFIAALTALAACSVKPDEAKVYFSSQSSGLAAEILETEIPNSYTVKLKWPSYDGAQSITIKRTNEEGETSQIDTIPSIRTDYVDASAKPGHSYSYRIVLLNSDGLQESDALDIAVPLDAEFQRNGTIGTLGREIRRLFIRKDVVLTTEGRNTSLDVDQIIAEEGATLETRPKESEAAAETEGISGGSFTIKSRIASGVLRLIAVGQNGGRGSNGSRGGAGGQGDKGGTAQTGKETECFRPTNPLLGFLLTAIGPGHDGCYTSTVCKSGPGRGGRGQRGQVGGSGMSGRSGGDSAAIDVAVEQPGTFRVHYQRIAGLAGIGGRGGDGGPGGPGGLPGDNKSPCQPAGIGPRGDQGPQGSNGPRGADGNFQPVCVRLGTVVFGDCPGGV